MAKSAVHEHTCWLWRKTKMSLTCWRLSAVELPQALHRSLQRCCHAGLRRAGETDEGTELNQAEAVLLQGPRRGGAAEDRQEGDDQRRACRGFAITPPVSTPLYMPSPCKGGRAIVWGVLLRGSNAVKPDSHFKHQTTQNENNRNLPIHIQAWAATHPDRDQRPCLPPPDTLSRHRRGASGLQLLVQGLQGGPACYL